MLACFAAASAQVAVARDTIEAINEERKELECHDPLTQFQMTMCAGLDHAEADLSLNAAYREAIARMKEIDSYQEADDRGAEAALRAAQRAWITVRDNHCKAQGYFVRGGSMEPMMVAGCMAQLTKTRTKELQELSASFP